MNAIALTIPTHIPHCQLAQRGGKALWKHNEIEAWERYDRLSESTKQLYEKLDRILTESNTTEIYTFVELLNELGFQLTITPKETQS